MQVKWSFGLIVVVYFGLASAVLNGQAADSKHFLAAGLVRFAADVDLPDISLPNLEGKAVSLRSFRGKVILLNFWTTW